LAPAQTAERQIHVSYHDLYLRRTADIRQLDHRLKVAIAAACSGDERGDWQRQLANKRCQAAKQREAAAPRSQALAKAGAADVEVASTR
jgi:UrcA family protein